MADGATTIAYRPARAGRGRRRARTPAARAADRVLKAAAAVRALISVSPRRRFFGQPFEIWLSLAGVMSGVPVALGLTRPVSLTVQLSPWVVRAWGVGLCLGGVVTMLALVRIAQARTELQLTVALRLEALGMTLFATSGAVYGLAVLAVGVAGLAAGPMLIAFSASCAMRTWNIARQLREDRAARQAPDV